MQSLCWRTRRTFGSIENSEYKRRKAVKLLLPKCHRHCKVLTSFTSTAVATLWPHNLPFFSARTVCFCLSTWLATFCVAQNQLLDYLPIFLFIYLLFCWRLDGLWAPFITSIYIFTLCFTCCCSSAAVQWNLTLRMICAYCFVHLL